MLVFSTEETIAATLALAEQQATWIGVGRVSVPPQAEPAADSLAGLVVTIDVEETLEGRTDASPLRALLRPGESDDPAASPADEADGFRGLLFLRERSFSADGPQDPLLPDPGDPILELPFGLDPDLAVGSPSYGDLRHHVERLLGLRRSRLEVILAALGGHQARLRAEAAFDVERTASLELLLRKGETELLLEALADDRLGDEARIALVQALRRVPAAAPALSDALRQLLREGGATAGPLRFEVAEVLADLADPADLELFDRLTAGERFEERAEGLAGLANLGTPEAVDRLALVAGQHPDEATRTLAADLLRGLGP